VGRGLRSTTGIEVADIHDAGGNATAVRRFRASHFFFGDDSQGGASHERGFPWAIRDLSFRVAIARPCNHILRHILHR
jgi:hypothetical protein